MKFIAGDQTMVKLPDSEEAFHAKDGVFDVPDRHAKRMQDHGFKQAIVTPSDLRRLADAKPDAVKPSLGKTGLPSQPKSAAEGSVAPSTPAKTADDGF